MSELHQQQSSMTWTTTPKERKFGVVVYNFFGSGTAATGNKAEDPNQHCLKLMLGDLVCILEEDAGWFRGYNLRDPVKKTGIFPANHVAIKPYNVYNGCLSMTSMSSEDDEEAVVPEEEDLMSLEAAEVLREWTELWHELFLYGDETKFNQLKKLMEQLLELRRQLISGHLTSQQRGELQSKIVDKINLGTRLCDLDIVAREVDGQAVNTRKTSAVHVFNRHMETSQRLLHPGERPPMAGLASHIEKKRDLRKLINHHLHIQLVEFSYPSEDLEIYFSLFSSKSDVGQFVSEKVYTVIHEGAVFMDVGTLDQIRDLYLVCTVIKNSGGKMGINNNHETNSFNTLTSSKKTTCFRRPYAGAAMHISKIITKGLGTLIEFEAKLQMIEDKEFYHLHEQIIKKTSKMSPLPGLGQASCIRVNLRLLTSASEILSKANPEVRRIGFPNVILPGDIRNDLYVTLERGNFDKSGKTGSRNIEITCLVIDQEGQIVENCIYYASGQCGKSRASLPILYHNNSPIWNENLRLQMPIDKFYNSHLRLEFRHCSAKDKNDKKLLGFAFMHLMDMDETAVKDGTHSLCLYKCEDASKFENCAIYLAMPSKLNEVTSLEQVTLSQGFVRSAKENVTIVTKLVSTKLTQNPDLMRLLNWKSNNQNVTDNLSKIMNLNGDEIVKFMQDILDALFAMFSTEDGNSTPHSGLVFHVLVSIISSLENPKYEQFKPVLDTYIYKHFAAALVYKGLLSCVRHCADLVTSTERQEPIQKCFRSLAFISKFIVQSRQLFARATQGQNEDGFRMDVHLLFNSFNKMLSVSYETILPAQILFLEHIHCTYPNFLKELSSLDLAKLVTLMLDSVTKDAKLMNAKLKALAHVIKSQIFQDSESRALLLPTCCEHLKMHLLGREELRLCSDILGDIIEFLSGKSDPKADQDSVHRDINVLVEIIMQPLAHTLINMEKDILSTIVGGLVSRLLGLFQLMDEQPHFVHLWERLGSKEAIKDFLLNIFHLFNELVNKDIYPSEWASMRFMAINVLLKTLQVCKDTIQKWTIQNWTKDLAKPLMTYFRDEGHFDSLPWTVYFHLGVAFIAQSTLQLDKYSNCKKQRFLDQYGDMRHQMAFQILSLWSHLGSLRLHFIPGMVGPFLEMTLIPEVELRKATIPLFFDLLECEYKAKGSFKQVESELIDKLDILVSENKGDEDYKHLFSSILMDNLTQKDPVWRENGKAFVESVTRLLERLLDYRNVGQGDENRDKRMSCTVNLLNFYRSEKNRAEMYLRYIYKLHDLHIPAGSYTEAAFTLKLHADDLAWSNRPLHSDLRYPSQKEWQRKEQLYLKIIDYFEKDKQWEHAIPLCKELSELYEKKVFDYAKLSGILKKQAALFEKVISSSQEGLRFDPEYFRVGFYGQGFPLFLRNKDFVYRGSEWEKISTFTQRLASEFPHAQLLTSNSREPDNTLKCEDGQFVQICCVKPVQQSQLSGTISHPMEGYDMPDKIRKFHQVNNISNFQYDRPYHKGSKDRDNEFKTLWIERTTYQIESPLPGILRWFEVCQTESMHVSPIEHACETVQAKNQELRTLIMDPEPVLKLTQSLQGVIDAAVNGGLTKYQEAFFKTSSDHSPEKVAQLQSLMIEQLNILESGLTTHKKLASQDLLPLHAHLVDRFATMKNSLSKTANSNCSKIVNTPLPPVPSPLSLTNTDIDNIDEGIYSKPSDLKPDNNPTVMTTSAYNYVWSPSSNYSPPPRPPSMRMKAYNELTNHHHHYHHHHRDSGIHVPSIGSSEDVSAPPLPPRSSYGSMSFSSSRSSRLSTFSSLTTMESTSMTSNTTSPTMTNRSNVSGEKSPSKVSHNYVEENPPPKLSPRDDENGISPPPIPPKKQLHESGL